MRTTYSQLEMERGMSLRQKKMMTSSSLLHASSVQAPTFFASGTPIDSGTASTCQQSHSRLVWASRHLHRLYRMHTTLPLHAPFPDFSLNTFFCFFALWIWVQCLCSPHFAACACCLYIPFPALMMRCVLIPSKFRV